MERDAPKPDTLSPEALLLVVTAAYDLPGPVTCDWKSSGLNDVFELTAGDETYYLKVYRAGWRTRPEVLDEIAALRHLDRKGVPVALPIARRDGEWVGTLPAPPHERQVVLFAAAKGEDAGFPDEATCHRYGQTLAALHNATDDFPTAPVRYDLDHLLSQPLHALEPYLAERPADRDYLRDLVRRLRERLETLPPGTLDHGYCHGDFRPANLRLDATTGTLTPFDFELGGAGFRAYDIAYTQTNLHHLARELLWRAPTLDNDEACWTAFLRGYHDRRPLPPAAREALPLFAAMRPLTIMGTLLQTARRKKPDEETWPPSQPGGTPPFDAKTASNGGAPYPTGALPGGDLFDRALRFLHAWDEAYL